MNLPWIKLLKPPIFPQMYGGLSIVFPPDEYGRLLHQTLLRLIDCKWPDRELCEDRFLEAIQLSWPVYLVTKLREKSMAVLLLIEAVQGLDHTIVHLV